ncbi:MAG: hypothetical protein AABZ31_00355 [Bdellovibrionota bacterium]
MSEIQFALPDAFFRLELKAQMGLDPLPLPGYYAVAQIFSSWGSAPYWKYFLTRAEELGLIIVAKRSVPVNLKMLWPQWHAIEPEVTQVFLQGASLSPEEFAESINKLESEMRFRSVKVKEFGPFYLCSLSSQTVTYRVPVTTKNPEFYYPDLQIMKNGYSGNEATAVRLF